MGPGFFESVQGVAPESHRVLDGAEDVFDDRAAALEESAGLGVAVALFLACERGARAKRPLDAVEASDRGGAGRRLRW